VCADIADFRGMAADEDMAIIFYKVADAVDLADQLIGLLQSPEQQQRMAEQNFSAAMQMTMSSVVRNYLRWFELKRCKKAIGRGPLFPDWRSLWRRSLFPGLRALSAGWTLRSELSNENGGNTNRGDRLESEDQSPQSILLTDPRGWQISETTHDQPDADRCQSPQLADDF
jgi:hypothetical protein